MHSAVAAAPVRIIPTIPTAKPGHGRATTTIPGDGGRNWWSTASTGPERLQSIQKPSGTCAGVNPRTGKGLVRGSGERHRAGWDITFSSPKTFGILWAAGSPEQRAVLETMQQEAVDLALQFLVDERLVEVRQGAGGHLRELPADILIAKFPHFTTREGDPACHTHCVLLNAARSSGDPKKYLRLSRDGPMLGRSSSD